MSQRQTCMLCGADQVASQLLSIPRRSFNREAGSRPVNLLTCRACGYMRNSDVVSERIAIDMQSHFDSQPNRPKARESQWPSRAALVARQLERLCPGKGRVLDIGCNTGVNLKALSPQWDKHGVELAKPLAKIARTSVPATVFDCPIEALPEQAGSFDLITAHAVIEHVFDPARFIAICAERLSPGGVLAIMTGDRDSTLARNMAEQWPLLISPDHVSFFSAGSLRQALKAQGFEVLREEWRHMYFEHGPGTKLQRIGVKLQEILGAVHRPRYDAYYVYARRGNSHGA